MTTNQAYDYLQCLNSKLDPQSPTVTHGDRMCPCLSPIGSQEAANESLKLFLPEETARKQHLFSISRACFVGELAILRLMTFTDCLAYFFGLMTFV